MSGLKVALPVAFTDTSLPVIHDDTLITAGSLALIDLNHSATTSAPANALALATAPADGLIVPNIAFRECAAVVGGSPSESSLAFTLTKDSGTVIGTDLNWERSGKGGIHGIVSNVNNSSGSHGVYLTVAAAIQAYIYANIGHQYYWSLWDSLTRISPSGSGSAVSEAWDISASTTRYWQRFYTTLTTNGVVAGMSSGTSGGVRVTPSSAAVGPVFRNIAESAFSGVTTLSNVLMRAGVWGETGGFNNQHANIHVSHIFYRYYLEDLTVSGRSYATVDAIDFALYQAAFASGGKYNGDTYTAVSSLP